jgi:hypothetical protein
MALVKNDDNLLPFQRLDTLRIAAITIGTQAEGPYATIFNKYQPGRPGTPCPTTTCRHDRYVCISAAARPTTWWW